MTDVIVREWVIPRGVGGPKGDEVPAISLEWKVNIVVLREFIADKCYPVQALR